MEGKAYHEFAAAPGDVLDADRAVVRLDELASQRQSKPECGLAAKACLIDPVKSVEDARRVLKSAQDTLAYVAIRAPFPGIVVKRFHNLGDFVSPGTAFTSTLTVVCDANGT